MTETHAPIKPSNRHHEWGLEEGDPLDVRTPYPLAPKVRNHSAPPDGLSLISSAEFLNSKYPIEWLVDGILVKGQPAVVGGTKKSLKTSFCVDLAVSVSSGNEFLGKYHVPKIARVAILSGESGEAVLQDTFRRVCQAKGIDEPGECQILWGFKLPDLSVPPDLEELGELIQTNAVDVVIIDPLYLCLLSGRVDLQASNLYQIGPLLKRIADTCLQANATPILVHHFRKSQNHYSPPELDQLAFAGVAEFARQWLLIGRRAEYIPGTGEHELWLSVGGSAGHSGLHALTIQEGMMQSDFSGRRWEVTVSSAEAVKQLKAEATKTRAAEKAGKRFADDQMEVINYLRKNGAETKTGIKAGTHLGKERLDISLHALVKSERIEHCKIEKGGGRGDRTYEAFRLAPPADIEPGETPLADSDFTPDGPDGSDGSDDGPL